MYVGNREIKVSGRGSRIAKLDADMYQFLSEPASLIEALRTCKKRVDLFTFMQRLPETQPTFSYPMEWDNLAVLPVSTFDEWWNKQIGFKARNRARQAEKKGVVVRETSFDENLVRGIWEIYNEAPMRQGRPFPHYGKDLPTVYKDEATYLNSSTFIGAYLGGELIGFIKLTVDELGAQAGLMNIISKLAHRDKSPTNALVAQAVRTCADRGIAYLVYSHFAFGERERDKLTDFKERNGFQRVDVPRYYVPLNSFGRLALRLGLHRRWIDRLPGPMAERLRALRYNWYNRKAQPEQVSS